MSVPERFAYQRYGLLGEPLRKMELAEKVLAGEKLTKTDRERDIRSGI